MSVSRLVAFYLGEKTDLSGRMIDEVLSWDDEKLEYVHDYIQWLFPLQERSAFLLSAPLITAEDIIVFRGNPEVREKLLLAFSKLLDFYGFKVLVDSGVARVIKSQKFKQKSRNWLKPYNHNFLRITRILKSLVLLGCADYADAFLAALEEVYRDNAHIIGEETLCFWRNSIKSS